MGPASYVFCASAITTIGFTVIFLIVLAMQYVEGEPKDYLEKGVLHLLLMAVTGGLLVGLLAFVIVLIEAIWFRLRAKLRR